MVTSSLTTSGGRRTGRRLSLRASLDLQAYLADALDGLLPHDVIEEELGVVVLREACGRDHLLGLVHGDALCEPLALAVGEDHVERVAPHGGECRAPWLVAIGGEGCRLSPPGALLDDDPQVAVGIAVGKAHAYAEGVEAILVDGLGAEADGVGDGPTGGVDGLEMVVGATAVAGNEQQGRQGQHQGAPPATRGREGRWTG